MADNQDQDAPPVSGSIPDHVLARETSSVPEVEVDPKKSRLSLRKVPDEPSSNPALVQLAQRKKSRAGGLRNDDTLVKVDLLPSGDFGARVDVTSYGEAPRVVEVFPEEDLDDIIEAEEVQQIELNIETEAQAAMLNFDLSTEYQRPRIDRALEYRKLHMPTKGDGEQFPFWSTKTGRFIPKNLARCDLFREGRKSELMVFGPGVSAYFKFLKSLFWLFLVMCILSLPFIIFNVNAGKNFTNHPFPFAQTTLGNLFLQVNTSDLLLSNQTALQALNETLAGGFVTYTLRLPAFCSGNPEGCTFKRTDLLLAYSLYDAAITVIFVIAVNILLYFTNHETVIYKEKIPKIEDYSIQTSVPDTADAKGLQAHFESILKRLQDNDAIVEKEKFSQVYDVQIVESTGNAISLCIRRGFLLKKLARLDAKIKVMRSRGVHENRIAPIVKKFERVRDYISKLDEKAMARAEKGRALMAFVTFESQEAKVRMLHEYDVFWACGRQPERLKYEGNNVMLIKSAPPPSTLLWENQEIAIGSRVMRLVISLVILCGILGLTAGLSFITDSNRVFSEVLDVASGQTYIRCNGKYDNATSLAEAADLAQNDGNVNCFCDYELLAPKPENSTDNGFLFAPGGFCADYAFRKATAIGKEIGLSFAIVVINLLIFKVVLVTADFMKFKNVVDREFAVLRSIFIITLINTAVICVLVNTDFNKLTGSSLSDVSLSDGTTLIKIGQFVDFEPGWYSRSGVELFIIGLLNILAPHVLPMLRYFYHVLERRYFAPYAVSQQVLNEMYIGEEFLLSVRLAQTLMMIFFVMLYSSGMPIMYWVGLVSVSLAYWLDKFFFVRLVRTPPQFDTGLQLWTVATMEWAAIVHCCVGFWMYSSPRLFPLSAAEAEASVLSNLAQSLQITAQQTSNSSSAAVAFANEATSRFGRPESIIMLACAALILAWKSLRRFARTAKACANPLHLIANMVRACLGKEKGLRQVQKHILAADVFENALKKGRVVGVRSYNILANPFYQRVFQMQDGLLEDRDSKSRAESRDTKSVGETADKVDPELGSGLRAGKDGSYRGFQSLQDALNIRKGTAVSSIEGRSVWKDDGKSSVNSASSKATTQLYSKKDDAKSVTSTKSTKSDPVDPVKKASTRSIKAVKSSGEQADETTIVSSNSVRSIKANKQTMEEQSPPNSPPLNTTATVTPAVDEGLSIVSPAGDDAVSPVSAAVDNVASIDSPRSDA